VDVHDYSQVAWRVFNNVDPRRDMLLSEGPLDVLDHSSPTANWGAKMGIDATRKWRVEGHPREWPPDVVMDPEVVARVSAMWRDLGLPAESGGGGGGRARRGGSGDGPGGGGRPQGEQVGGQEA